MTETITFLTVLRKGKSPRAGQGLFKLEGQETGLTCDKNSSWPAPNQNWEIAFSHKRN